MQTAGTSSTIPTGTGPTFTDGALVWKWLSLINYVSLLAWQADTANYPLVLTQPYVVLLWNNTPIAGGSSTINISNGGSGYYFKLTGHTTTATNTITITCAAGESFRDIMAGQATALLFNAANGVSFTAPAAGSSGANFLYLADSNVIFDGIQVKDPFSGSGSTLVNFAPGGSTNTQRMQNCLIDGFGQTGGATVVSSDPGTGTLTHENNLIVDRQSGGGYSLTSQYSTTNVINCTVTQPSAATGVIGVGNTNGGTMVVRNCIIIGYDTTGSVYTTGTAAVDHCLFSTTSLATTGVSTGTGNLFSKTGTNQWVSPTVDFRLKSTADGKDVGIADTTNIPSSDDIARTSRPSGAGWDMGCWEYFVAALGAPIVIWFD